MQDMATLCSYYNIKKENIWNDRKWWEKAHGGKGAPETEQGKAKVAAKLMNWRYRQGLEHRIEHTGACSGAHARSERRACTGKSTGCAARWTRSRRRCQRASPRSCA